MTSQQVLLLEVDALMPDPTQPRRTFLPEEINRLADSIKARGVLSPLRVALDEDRRSWRIVLGESRWRAARAAGLTHVPCMPMDGQPSETDILSDQIIENVVRHALRPMELARSIDKLKRLKDCSSKQLAAELGLSGGSITRAEALLDLPADIQAMIEDGGISANAGYEISRLPDDDGRRELAHAVVSGRISRDGTAEAVRKIVGKKRVAPKLARLPLRLAGGVSMTVTAGSPLTWDGLFAAIEQVRKQAENLKRGGKDIAELPRSLAT